MLAVLCSSDSFSLSHLHLTPVRPLLPLSFHPSLSLFVPFFFFFLLSVFLEADFDLMLNLGGKKKKPKKKKKREIKTEVEFVTFCDCGEGPLTGKLKTRSCCQRAQCDSEQPTTHTCSSWRERQVMCILWVCAMGLTWVETLSKQPSERWCCGLPMWWH